VKSSILSLYTLLILLFTLSACSEKVETVVINQQPEPAAPDTLKTSPGEQIGSDDFQHIRIGELYPVRSFDPLFALNPSNKRALQLVYEGLVRLNKNGNIAPSIAKRWKITADSLSYTFTIRSDLFYQDSDVFVNGLGRRLKAQDISYIFHRMARQHVPPNAGKLFFDIEGFEAYFKEQRNTYLEENRKLERINGIDTPNDSTVVFNLARKDPQFLYKLASPYALVYPREAVSGVKTELHDKPVGTGPFSLSSIREDSLLIFKKNRDYKPIDKNTPEITLNRVDIISYSNETALLRAVSKRFIHILPELGPTSIQTFVDDNLTINSSYSKNYKLEQGGTISYRIFYNEGRNTILSFEQVAGILKNVNFNEIVTALNPSALEIKLSDKTRKTDIYQRKFNMVSTLPDDPFTRFLYMEISNKLSKLSFNFSMLNTAVPTSDINFYTLRTTEFDNTLNTDQPILDIDIRQLAYADLRIKNFSLNSHPWWFDIRSVSLQPVAK